MGNFFEQIGFAFKCFFLVLFAGRLPERIPERFLEKANADTPLPPDITAEPDTGRKPRATGAATAAPDTGDSQELQVERAVQLLALLQRDGRLVDFLFEDIAAYPDDQVGAAVREVHASCREVLRRYLAVEPVLAGEEGRPTLVEAGFDPGAIKLVGAVTGEPPFRGVLRHRGWQVARVQLPALPDGATRKVVAPAEVEIG